MRWLKLMQGGGLPLNGTTLSPDADRRLNDLNMSAQMSGAFKTASTSMYSAKGILTELSILRGACLLSACALSPKAVWNTSSSDVKL